MALSNLPEWPLHTRWPFLVLFLGWWLIEQMGVYGRQPLPRPSISVSSMGMVPLGGNVTIHCSCENNRRLWFYLYKNRNTFADIQVLEKESCVVAFYRVPTRQDVGVYSCRYCDVYICSSSKDPWYRDCVNDCSAFSDEVYINITDPSLTKPSIKMTLIGKSHSRLNVTITCEGPKNGLMFALYKSKEKIAFQHAERKTNTTTFQVFMERPEDALNYSCQYRQKGNWFVWSEPSDPEELKMEGESLPSNESVILWAGIAAGLLLLLLLLLLVAFVLHKKKRRGSFVKEEIQAVDKPSEYLGGGDPNEVSYAVLNHQSLKVKQTTSPDTVSESCVYATIAKG